MNEDLILDEEKCNVYEKSFENIDKCYVDLVNDLGKLINEIPNVWSGCKSKKFCESWESFEPGLVYSYNIIEKSRNDLISCVNSIIDTDER